MNRPSIVLPDGGTAVPALGQAAAMSADLGRRAFAALSWNYGGALVRMLLQLLIQLGLARLLGPAAFGEATAALIVLGVGWLFAEAGFGAALIQKQQIDDADVGFALGWILLISVLLGLAIAASSPWLAAALGSPRLAGLVALAGALIPLQAVSNLPISLMQRALDMKRLQILQTLGYLVAYGGVGLTLAALGWGAWALMVAFAVQTAVNLLGSYACVRHTLRPRLRGDAGLRRFGLTVSATNLVNWALENLDRMMISRLWGPLALGEYAAAANLSRAPVGLMISSAQSVAFSSASRLQHDAQRLARAGLAALSLVFLLVAPLFVFLALHASALVHLLYGSQWRGAGPLFAAFCVAVPWLAVLAIVGPLMRAVGAVRAEFGLQLAVLLAMALALFALSAHPLREVVWLIPALALLRAGAACRVLAGRLGFGLADLLHALAGGLLCALLVAATCLLVEHWILPQLPVPAGNPAAAQAVAALAAALTSALLAWLLLRARGAALLAPQLRQLLLAQGVQSVRLARLCRCIGLRPEDRP